MRKNYNSDLDEDDADDDQNLGVFIWTIIGTLLWIAAACAWVYFHG